MISKKFIIFAVCLLISLQAPALLAEQPKPRGKVLKLSGDVEVINAKGEKRSVVKADEKISEMDTVVTKEGARIVMLFDDGSLSVLNEKSRLRIEKTNWFSYLGGKIYFTFRKVFGEKRRVKTRAATIGVRGTTFVISENSNNDGESVALKEGLLQIESTGPAFEIHKKKVLNEFEQYKLDQLRARADLLKEFEQYKKQTMQEFVEYRREFTLQPNRVINLSGYRIDEMAMSEENKADFESFEAEAEDMIKAFRAMSPGE